MHFVGNFMLTSLVFLTCHKKTQQQAAVAYIYIDFCHLYRQYKPQIFLLVNLI